jgi:drug/metabolite transporter (DMT)-like permease
VDAVLLACIAAAGFGALAVTVRIGLRRCPDPELGPALISVVACALMAVVAAATGGFEGLTFENAWPFLAIGAVVPGFSQLLFVRAVRDAGPSRAAVLMGTAPIASAAIAVVFLGEPLRATLGVATILIVAGGALLAWERERPPGFRMIGAVLALTCAVLFAVRDNLVRVAVRDHDLAPLAAASVSLVGATIVLVAIVLVSRRRSAPSPKLGAGLVAFIPAGICLGVGYAALIEAFDRGRVTVVAPLNATQSLWAVVLSAAVLGRSDAVGRRLVLAAILIVAGSAIIGATR